jgi:hypothetical protein
MQTPPLAIGMASEGGDASSGEPSQVHEASPLRPLTVRMSALGGPYPRSTSGVNAMP